MSIRKKIINTIDSKGNCLVELSPETSFDTYMASVCLILFGKETRAHRKNLRTRLLGWFKRCLFDEECFKFNCVKTFVARLNATHGEMLFPKSAETCFQTKREALLGEGSKFLEQSATREGYIYDRFTYGYLVADVFNVNVVIHEERTIELSKNCLSEDDPLYEIHLSYDGTRFKALVPKINRVPFSMAEAAKMKNFELRRVSKDVCDVVTCFSPPAVIGYRVYICYVNNREKNTMYTVTQKNNFRFTEATYIIVGEECVGYADQKHNLNPYFYLKEPNDRVCIALVNAKSIEDAMQCVQMEINGAKGAK
jgi:hypothetical protein